MFIRHPRPVTLERTSTPRPSAPARGAVARSGPARCARPSRRRARGIAGLICAPLCASLAGCDWDLNRSKQEPPRVEIAANEPAPRAAPPMGTPLQKEDDGRPSTDENMGRGFQGVIEWSVVTPKGAPRGVRYLARGNDARLQIDGQNGHGAFDALLWGENMSVIDNEQHTFRTVPLDQVPVSGKDDDVRVMKTGERRMLQGVLVERYEIDEAPLHVTAWVTGLPGTFSTEKFEQVSGHDVPSWAQHLLDDEKLPLEARARDANGRELYRLELLRYAGGPVDEASLALPENYTPADDSTSAKPPRSSR